MAIDEDRLRAEFCRSPEGHGGMHTEFPSFVGCSRDYTSFISLSSNDNRLAFQRWVEQLFYRNEESVHVNVKDGAWGGRHK